MKTATQIRIEAFEETLRGANQTIKAQKAQIAVLKTTSDWDPYWCYVCDRPNHDCACELDPDGPLPQSGCMKAEEAHNG